MTKMSDSFIFIEIKELCKELIQDQKTLKPKRKMGKKYIYKC